MASRGDVARHGERRGRGSSVPDWPTPLRKELGYPAAVLDELTLTSSRRSRSLIFTRTTHAAKRTEPRMSPHVYRLLTNQKRARQQRRA